ncbi:hypothetical protein JB92DRAFT_3015426 [Gautieria morchelliformis]|nr:hypothetical protein JB92DRAFT_3015426 [Gautieria morchelliformis]
MNLSGAAATTAIIPTMQCSPIGREPSISCLSTKVLLAFTWLSTITLLTYLLGLVVCAVYHSQGDSHVWRSGVRDYRWFTQRKPLEVETKLSYGKLVEPGESSGILYAQQMGLTRNYSIEPLKLETTVERPVPPVPAASPGSRAIPFGRDSYRFPRKPTPTSASTQPYSLYPQHLQATVGMLPAVLARDREPSPPPGGIWPRSNPQEPLRRKERQPQSSASKISSNEPHAFISSQYSPEMAEQGAHDASSSAARSRPSGPRRPSTSQRPRPPPLDLSRVSPYNG